MYAQLNQATSGDEIKTEVVRASLQRLEHCLGRLKPLRFSATGIEKEVSHIRGYAQEIEVELPAPSASCPGSSAGRRESARKLRQKGAGSSNPGAPCPKTSWSRPVA
jgi:hypothetical protein